MRQFVILLAAFSLTFVSARAQNFMEHLQKKDAGKGVVVVKQSKEIDELVNGNKNAADAGGVKNGAGSLSASSTADKGAGVKKDNERTSGAADKKTGLAEGERRHVAAEHGSAETASGTVDLSHKVMRQAYRVTGYRVQIFSGGNSRQDRKEAESIGASIKQKFPAEPVYVHFYSPRWTCRMGNYRTYEEANRVLKEVKRLGYKQTAIVKGTITVQN